VTIRPGYRNECLDRRTRLRPPRQRLSSNALVVEVARRIPSEPPAIREVLARRTRRFTSLLAHERDPPWGPRPGLSLHRVFDNIQRRITEHGGHAAAARLRESLRVPGPRNWGFLTP